MGVLSIVFCFFLYVSFWTCRCCASVEILLFTDAALESQKKSSFDKVEVHLGLGRGIVYSCELESLTKVGQTLGL